MSTIHPHFPALTLPDLIGCVAEWHPEGPVWPDQVPFRAYFRRVEPNDDADFAILVVQPSRRPLGSSESNYRYCMFLCEQFPSLKPSDSRDGIWCMNKIDYAKMRLTFGGGW